MGRSQRSKKGRYLRTQRRELLADENEKKDSVKRDVMAKILAAPSPAEGACVCVCVCVETKESMLRK